MSRSQELSGTVNPVVQYVKWASNDKKFSFYRKESKEKGFIDLPVEAVFLKTSSTVKGWSDANDCGIFSNQVTNLQNETLVVKAGDMKIASGLYRDIKDTVKAAGGKFYLNVFVLINGEISVLELKGAALMEWMEFFKRNKVHLDAKTIVVKLFNEGKKGAVKYTTPKFEVGSSIKHIDEADAAYDLVKVYLSKPDHVDDDNPIDVVIESEVDDDLPF